MKSWLPEVRFFSVGLETVQWNMCLYKRVYRTGLSLKEWYTSRTPRRVLNPPDSLHGWDRDAI